MVVYIITLIIATFIAKLAEYYREKEYKYKLSQLSPFLIILLILFLTFISGFRYNNFIYSDEYNYRVGFDLLIGQKFDWSQIKFGNEFGFYIFRWILANLFKNSQSMIILAAAFTNTAIIKMLVKYARPFWLAVFLYISGGFYFMEMNATRQYIAVAIFCIAVKFVAEKKLIPYIVLCLLASSFHITALMMIPFYFILKKQFNLKTYVAFSIVTIFILSNLTSIIKIFSSTSTRYELYYNDIIMGTAYGVNIIRIMIWVIVCAVIIIGRKNWVKYEYLNESFINYIIISTVIMISSSTYVYIARLDAYFSVIGVLILAPKIPELFGNKNKNIILIAMLILFFIFASYQMKDFRYHNILFENINGVLVD